MSKGIGVDIAILIITGEVIEETGEIITKGYVLRKRIIFYALRLCILF